jgi:predicted HicB family RNase H-like nuclease
MAAREGDVGESSDGNQSGILHYKGYQGRFEYDADADLFHGEVLLPKDVVTFQGWSMDGLQQALADSVEDYLDFRAQKATEVLDNAAESKQSEQK